MLEIAKRVRIEAAHHLPRVPSGHPCSRVHGHSYVFELGVQGETDESTGWIIDFADIGAAFEPVRASLDHQLLNDVPGLENPTCEVLARWVYDTVAEQLPQLAWVRVSETESSSCLYRPHA